MLVKTLSTLNQQNLDKQIVDVLEQSNKYMQEVQDELDRKNWREVIEEAAYRKDDVFAGMSEEQGDPEVDRMYAELERQVTQQKGSNLSVQQKMPSALLQQSTSGLSQKVIEVPLISKVEESNLSHQQQEIHAPLTVGPLGSQIKANTSSLSHQAPPSIVVQPTSAIKTSNIVPPPSSKIGVVQPINVSNLSVGANSQQQQILSQTSSLMRSEAGKQQTEQAQHTSSISQQQMISKVQAQSNIKTSEVRQ